MKTDFYIAPIASESEAL